MAFYTLCLLRKWGGGQSSFNPPSGLENFSPWSTTTRKLNFSIIKKLWYQRLTKLVKEVSWNLVFISNESSKSFQYGALWNKDPCWISHPLLWPLAKKFWSFSRDICQYTLPLSKSKLLIKGVVFLLHRTCSRCIRCCQWCTKNHTRPEWVREISWRFIIQWLMGLATQKLVH